MGFLARWIYLKLLGWKIVGDLQIKHIKKAVVIGAPHTSWHDFYIGILFRKVLNVKINFIAKKELFIGPLGWYLRAVGGFPINRLHKENKVITISNFFRNHDEFRLAIAPEGTRKKVSQWKTGFYYIAKHCNVPIIMITFDYKNKQNRISPPFYPTNDIDADFKFMHQYFNGIVGKIKKYS